MEVKLSIQEETEVNQFSKATLVETRVISARRYRSQEPWRKGKSFSIL